MLAALLSGDAPCIPGGVGKDTGPGWLDGETRFGTVGGIIGCDCPVPGGLVGVRGALTPPVVDMVHAGASGKTAW
jgi:hypothetical protein